MHKIASILAVSAFALVLAACGGSDDKAFVGSSSSSSSSSASSTGSAAANVTVSSSSATIPADGSATATISALVRDSNNVALQGVTVAFSSTAGSLQVTQATTDATGTATATLSASGATSGTNITVTATAGTVSGKASIGVVASQQTLTLLTSSPQMPSDGSEPATIQAIVRDASNKLLSGVVINFSASSGAVTAVQTTAGAAASPVVPAGTTDANGEAWAQLTTPGDPSNRTITVTATIGSTNTSATVTVAVIGTKLSLSGPTSLIMGNSGTFSISLTDSGGNGISGQAVTLSSANGNTLSAASVSTDPTGHATFQVTAAKSGNDTVTATALGLSASQALAVSSQNFAFTAPAANSTVAIGVSQSVTLVWTNGGAPVAGQTVSFSTTRGTFSGGTTTTTATTDSTGTATVSVSASTAGPAVISATATGVSTQLSLAFIATTPASIDLQASPTTIPTQGSSTITAIVRDAQNNLVEGQTVDFQLTDKTGGSITVATATTDVQGEAQTVYDATTVASTSNGVQITASIPGTSVPSSSVLITVGGQTVFLSLGTGNTITQLPAGCGSSGTLCTQFSMPFSVLAVDSGGNPVPGVSVTLTVHSLPPPASDQNNTGALATNTIATGAGYAKGCWVWGGSAWVQSGGNGTVCLNQPITALTYCLNEDVLGTGIYDAADDANGNGRLDPGDVATVSPGSITTDSTGSGQVTVVYPQDHAQWVQVVLTATASVNGTQSSTTSTFWLPILATDVTSQTVTPPGVTSPYGIATQCANPN